MDYKLVCYTEDLSSEGLQTFINVLVSPVDLFDIVDGAIAISRECSNEQGHPGAGAEQAQDGGGAERCSAGSLGLHGGPPPDG